MRRLLVPLASLAWVTMLLTQALLAGSPRQAGVPAPAAPAGIAFETSDNCLACHNGLRTPAGEDVSIGTSWRSSMMANSARDPYWQATVRREATDHPTKAALIEDECTVCHMPMTTTVARAAGRDAEAFRLFPSTGGSSDEHLAAADGVSCSLCHQIGPERLGTRESFTGGYVVASAAGGVPRRMGGPHEITKGLVAIMQSSTGAEPGQVSHIRDSEICATCHTLLTEAFGPNGEVVGSIAEQVPYLEWRQSAFATVESERRSCQSCHMPEATSTPIASVLGEPRDRMGRHTFLGGNFFMLRMLNRYRAELGVTAPSHEMEASAQATLRQLQTDTADLIVRRAEVEGGRLAAELLVRNRTGHKLPTGYPSRRAWLHAVVRDAQGRVVFESGAVNEDGSIRGNDNDADAQRFEPHYTEIRREDEVQIYEGIMADVKGAVTTGLLHATQYLKDNRLLPRGFDKGSAQPEVAVHGAARNDADFRGEEDTVAFSIDVGSAPGPYTLDVELRFQPIGFRWANNLRGYGGVEPRRFMGYWDSMASSSSTVLARVRATTR